MSASVHDQKSAPAHGVHPAVMSRPQVGIERLPARRHGNEPRESMNCKSCRKRKIKCNRLRPACEACQVFQCACIYDAVPKKRGPKTDVLEALLKRVDGLEAKLREKNTEETSSDAITETPESTSAETILRELETAQPPPKRHAVEISTSPTRRGSLSASVKPCNTTSESSPIYAETLLDTYFAKLHAKPYYVLDEPSTRQRMQLNQLPEYLSHAIFAVAARYAPNPRGLQAAVKLSEGYAAQARDEIDMDEPSVDALQALVLLVIAFTAAGKGKKTYMLMTLAVGMATALELHREMDSQALVTPMDREMRRRLFWTCYLLDRYLACGSKRPSLISDATVMLRLPSWSLSQSAPPVEGEFFQSNSNLQYFQSTGKKSQGSTGMLIDISRILGATNRYLAAGGVKGDSHFPWHALSNLSKIRQDLEIWASGTDDVFSSIDALFGQVDSTILVFSKLIYHLIHCLIYRPFLPIDLAELAGNGQHQSWQIEATNMCFLHANAITELIDLGSQASTIEWPAFVGYCICTAGTVHVHGAHYSKQGAGGDMNFFSSSTDFVSREVQQLSTLRYAWASVQQQCETLQGIFNAHNELVKAMAGNAMRYSPGFHLEDFFDRYSNIGGAGGQSFHFDAANLSLSDVFVDIAANPYSGHDLFAARGGDGSDRPALKRRNTGSSLRKRPDIKALMGLEPTTSDLTTRNNHRSMPRHSDLSRASPALLMTTTSLQPQMQDPEHHLRFSGMQHSAAENPSPSTITGFGMPASGQTPAMSQIAGNSFDPSYGFGVAHPTAHDDGAVYDPMFGVLPTTNFSSPNWHGDDGQNRGVVNQVAPGVAAPSPSQKSNNGSTGHQDEKDPFLSLLEQLAENEQHFGSGGATDLDFFLTGNGNAS